MQVMGSITGSGRSPGVGNDNPLQYSCLGNPMDTRAWLATIREVAKIRHNRVTKHTHKHTSALCRKTFEGWQATRSVFRLECIDWDFPGGSVVKNPFTHAGNTGSVPGSGRSPGKGNDNLLQYSCLENLMD